MAMSQAEDLENDGQTLSRYTDSNVFYNNSTIDKVEDETLFDHGAFLQPTSVYGDHIYSHFVQ